MAILNYQPLMLIGKHRLGYCILGLFPFVFIASTMLVWEKDWFRPALGMFVVFGRTGPQTLGGLQFLTLEIPYKLTCQCQFCQWLWCLDYGANTCCNRKRFVSIQCSKMRLRPWLRCRPRLGSLYLAPRGPSSCFKGATRGREGMGRKRRGTQRGEDHRLAKAGPGLIWLARRNELWSWF